MVGDHKIVQAKDELNGELRGIVVKDLVEENQIGRQRESERTLLLDTIQADCSHASKNLASIDITWSHLYATKDSSELLRELDRQKNSCRESIVIQKDQLNKFLVYLSGLQEDFVKSIRRYTRDSLALSSRMNDNIRRLETLLISERSSMERAFLSSRTDLLQKQHLALGDLFERRRLNEESEFLDKRVENGRIFYDDISHLWFDDISTHKVAKLALDKAAQELEQHLMKMTAVFQLNKEKLEYNLQVLIERNKEHETVRNSCKSRLNRLRSIKTALENRLQRIEDANLAENSNLSQEFQRFAGQYREMQERLKHAEEVGALKFADIWNMHQTEAKNVASKLLNADRVIHESVIGLPWQHPKEEQLRAEADAEGSQSGTGTMKTQTGSSSHVSRTSRFPAAKSKKVLDLVFESAQFLLGDTVDMKVGVATECLLSAIGVDSIEDVDLLVEIFYKGQDEDDEELLADPADVIPLIAEFVKLKEEMRIADVSPVKRKKSVGVEEAEVRSRRRREEQKFWQRLAHVLPTWRVQRVYPSLLSGSRRFLELLQRRDKNISSCQRIKVENDRLRSLAAVYLAGKVNTELLIPPSSIIKMPKIE